MLAGGVLYLDSFRERLIDQRHQELRTEVRLIAASLGEAGRQGMDTTELNAFAARLGQVTRTRLRLFGSDGQLLLDSWDMTGPTYRLRDPASEPLRRHVARFLDRTLEWVAAAPEVAPYVEPPRESGRAAWPEAVRAAQGRIGGRVLRASDGTPVLTIAAPVPGVASRAAAPLVVHATIGTRDITRIVRDERFNSFLIFLTVLGLSVLLSTYLARTIVRPLRMLAIAARRVRLGRSREVIVPRLPSRRDEIGELARAVSDMSQALRQRIDATEAFAADVAHELKNPLASVRSAVEALDRVGDEALRRQLLALIQSDVRRIDRLVTNIAEVSRLDAELSRTRFRPVDLDNMVATLVGMAEAAGMPRGVRLAYARPAPGTANIDGDELRLGQVIRNLVDNAISFSPEEGLVRIAIIALPGEVLLRVDDDGPGVPPESREAIFRRFYSERPAGDTFGTHSGLGLAIARAIVEAHHGTIYVENREAPDGSTLGASFHVRLPVHQRG